MTEANAQNRLPGAWKLLSWQIFGSEPDSITEPFGSKPVGLLQYTPDGWMSAAICRPDRPLLPTGIGPKHMAAEPLADSWRSYFHYAGRWRIEGDVVIHSVELSLNPALVNTDQVRQMQFGEGRLTLSGIEMVGQKQRKHVLHWQRAV